MKRLASPLLATLAALSPFAAAQSVLRFDMGDTTSPLAPGFLPVHAGSAYSSAVGWGWTVAPGLRPYVRPAPVSAIRHDLPVPLIQDGLSASQDCTFRSDLADGEYLCVAYLGDTGTETARTPRSTLDVLANGLEVVSDAYARTVTLKARFDTNAYGGYKRVRFLARPVRGAIEVTFHCDGRGESINSMMGLEIYPNLPAPIRFDHGTSSLVADPAFATVLAPALAAFNAHDYAGARKQLDAVSDPLARAWGYAWLLGWLTGDEVDADAALLESTRKLLEGLQKPDDPRVAVLLQDIRDFALGLRCNELRGYSAEIFPDSLGDIVANLSAAVQLFEQMDDDMLGAANPARPECPLFAKAHYLVARNMYSRYTGVGDPTAPWAAWWLGILKNDFVPRLALFPKSAELEVFTFFATRYGMDGGIVKNWRGPSSVPAFDPRNTWWAPIAELPDDAAAPMWANHQRAYLRQFRNAGQWWMERRLFGAELGGGGGDDVEGAGLLSLPTIARTEPRHVVERGIEQCLAKVLFGPEVNQEQGYFGGCADVEHTGEYTSYPLFALLPTNFGTPAYIEAGTRAIRNMDELADPVPWTQVIAPGQRHFRSYLFGATSICGPARDCPLNVRAIIPGFFLMDYNNSPRIKQLFDELARAWADNAMSTAQGKPKGIPPCSVSSTLPAVFGTGGEWWKNGGYVDLPGGTAYYPYLYALFLAAYHNSTAVDRHLLLEPVLHSGYLAWDNLKGLLTGTQPGGDKWTSDALMSPIADALAEAYPALAADKTLGLGQTELDKLSFVITQRASPYLKYLHASSAATKDKSVLESTFHSARTWLRYFWVLGSSSVTYTDRIYVMGNTNAHQLLYSSLMGGAFSVNPSYVLSWVNPDTTAGELDIAALVHDFGVDSLDVLLFNFDGKPRDIAFRLWRRLAFGKYRVSIGDDANHDDRIDSAAHTVFDVDYDARGLTIVLPKVPAGVLQKVELRRITSLPGAGAMLPDLAVGEADVWLAPGGKARITVHNLGSADVTGGTLSLYEGAKHVGSQPLPPIAAPNDLTPRSVTLEAPYVPSGPSVPLTVRLALTAGKEVTLFNNEVTTVPATFCPTPVSYGTGLRGARGIPVLAASGGLPRAGNLRFGFAVSSVYGNAPFAYVLGVQPASYPVLGGYLLVEPALILPAVADGSGAHLLPLPIPNDPTLAGGLICGQIAVMDRTAVQGVALSAGLGCLLCEAR